MSRGSTRVYPERPSLAWNVEGYLLGADNGASRSPYSQIRFQVFAHGGFSPVTPGGDFQPMISVFCQVRGQLLVPVIAFYYFVPLL